MHSVISQSHLQLVPNESAPFSTLTPEQEITDRRVKKVIRFMQENLTRRLSLTS